MTKRSQFESSSLPFQWEGFTFLGGSLEREALSTNGEDANPFEDTTFSLAQSKAGDSVSADLSVRLCIVGFKGNADAMQQLNHLGVYPGAVVQVICRSLSGSVIVTIAGRRLGLGRQVAQQVMVCQG